MKNYLVVVLSLLMSQFVDAQINEFTPHSNGLIYSVQTMGKLANIVDSLNLKYKTCELDKVFLSKAQTVGHKVKLEKGDIKAALQDINNEIPFKEFQSKYPEAKIEENVLVVRFNYTDYEDKDIIEFREIRMDGEDGFEISKSENLKIYSGKLQSKWLLEHWKKTEYWEESIRAFYFPNELKSIPLEEKYARMVGYTDCLIDTTSTKLKEDLKHGWASLPNNWKILSKKEQEKLLEEMRSIKIVGSCSMDSSPRDHAFNIAMLSAETTNWEVFLKAHLDIMNDKFDRASDGSYAWGERKTYIKELEELNINVLDLLIGISLRIENPAKNHYFGSISRIGRALSETENRGSIEKELLAMIKHQELDDYNRILAYYLFYNYTAYLTDKTKKSKNFERLKEAISFLPDYLSRKSTMELVEDH